MRRCARKIARSLRLPLVILCPKLLCLFIILFTHIPNVNSKYSYLAISVFFMDLRQFFVHYSNAVRIL